MHRLFKTTKLRLQTYLNGRWAFLCDPYDEGEEKRWFESFPTETDEQWVPSVWNTTHGYLNYEGPAWYHCTFSTGDCTALIVNFGAALHQARVWLDGKFVGEHIGGFTPFSFLIKNPSAGPHSLTVRVDSTLDMETTIPHAHIDWYHYGGLSRPVWVEEVKSNACIHTFNVLPRLDGTQGIVTVRTRIINLSNEPIKGVMRLEIEEKEYFSEPLALATHEERDISFDVPINDPQIWQPHAPYLYTARITFENDDQIERFGLRSIEIHGNQILLNGHPIKLLGASRHEDHPDWGASLPETLMRKDLDIVKELGCNTIRGGHYPNDPRFLDMCDERGVLFFEEIPIWGLDEAKMKTALIRERAIQMLQEMIKRDMNHPSIWAWSMMNECATNTSGGRELVQTMLQMARRLDPTRPVTFVTHFYEDICFDLADVVCINSYTDWYLDDLDAIPWPEIFDRVRERPGVANKPLIMSEFGAGAVPGCRHLEGVRWSEEYQSNLIVQRIKTVLSREDVAGFYIWHLFDFHIAQSDAERVLRRPRSYNNKGLLDEYRRPKLAFWMVRQLLKTSSQLS